MIIAECKAARDAIQETIQKLRDNPTVDAALCNLLENHTNSLLGDIRSRTHCTVMEIPQIQTFAGVSPCKRDQRA